MVRLYPPVSLGVVFDAGGQVHIAHRATHYVPIQLSYEDLYDAVSFFRVHDALGRWIARAGRAWSRRFWRKEDMTAYLYR